MQKKQKKTSSILDWTISLKNSSTIEHILKIRSFFCNCDDPYESNFFKYFALNFNALGLKKLIATCYDGSPVQGNELLLDFGDVVNDNPKKIAYKVEITEVTDVNGDGAVDLADIRFLMQNDKNVISTLKGNGDFRSQESIELLKQADIVVTNPPFSLFREYVTQLIEFNKKFLIIGNCNAVNYLCPLFKENKLWLGCSTFNCGMYFEVPDSYQYAESYKFLREINGKKVMRVSSICWYTNLDHKKRHETIDLYKKYNPEDYPRYDNYDAIDCGKVADIPMDYDGVIGVPITFLDKYCPEQFYIVGITYSADKNHDIEEVRTDPKHRHVGIINGKEKYPRILIRKKQ